MATLEQITRKIVESSEGAVRPFVESLVREFLRELVAVPIEGKVIGFTGHGPYRREDLEKLAIKLGAVLASPSTTVFELSWFIIGREGFDEELVDNWTMLGDRRYLSQEQFVGLLLFGYQTSHNGENRNEMDHPGISHADACAGSWDSLSEELLSFNFDNIEKSESGGEQGTDEALGALPQTATHETEQPLLSTDGWSEESDLKSLGYSVARNVTLYQRRDRLYTCVSMLGKRQVMDHLVRMIQLHRKDYRWRNPVSKWMEDLDWVRSSFGDL